MADVILWLASTLMVVAMVTCAPMPSSEMMVNSVGDAKAEGMQHVAKRAEEMMFYGNQQNEPRVSAGKRTFDQESSLPELGEIDQGSRVVAHEEVPVEEDLIARAEAVKGAPQADKMAEAMKIAKEQAEQVEKEENQAAASQSGSNSGSDYQPSSPVTTDSDKPTSHQDSSLLDLEGDELSSLATSNSNTSPVSAINMGTSGDSSGDHAKEVNNGDNEDVNSFLEDLRKEIDESNDGAGEEEEEEKELKDGGSGVDSEGEASKSGDAAVQGMTPKEGFGNGASNYYLPYDTMRYYGQQPAAGIPLPELYYLYRKRRSLVQRRRSHIPSIRRRRNGRVRRIKRDLPSDWLNYRGLDTDDLISEPEYVFENDDELDRYIYANLLNLLSRYGGEEELEKELLPYTQTADVAVEEIPDRLLEAEDPEVYDPEELSYYLDYPEESRYYEEPVKESRYYQEPVISTRKRSGGYVADSRRKRFFYPAYEEPDTHWGAFIPEKRSYNDAVERLQRLAFALGDTPATYYESEYRKK